MLGPFSTPKMSKMTSKVVRFQKSRRSGRFVLFVPLVSSRLVVLVVPGGGALNLAAGYGFPAAS